MKISKLIALIALISCGQAIHAMDPNAMTPAQFNNLRQSMLDQLKEQKELATRQLEVLKRFYKEQEDIASNDPDQRERDKAQEWINNNYYKTLNYRNRVLYDIDKQLKLYQAK